MRQSEVERKLKELEDRIKKLEDPKELAELKELKAEPKEEPKEDKTPQTKPLVLNNKEIEKVADEQMIDVETQVKEKKEETK